ncbi:hypothetical protein BUALT_Bualt03G0188300 [Buddleja alternifolia]|uniref:Trichome birefringence-like C-terminal domain-containing protein n=1 Tax=Buddleja alternifolia TaxID=168488 RepID=A0AAV6Y1J3_9LAMI|nr:hypothetical protein BUALT_Bualt03G0188300 [Buddleja alternifolia]
MGGYFVLKALFISAFVVQLQTKAAAQEEGEAEHYLLNATSAADRSNLAGTGCNIFRGKWVYDASYPLYDFSKCPFLDDEFNCLKYRRPDQAYLNFNGLNMLEKWRGKKIMFVGDSLSLNMWQSLGCMIHSWVPQARTSLVRREGLAEITFLDYGVRLLLYRTPYLVDIENQKVGRVLKLDSIRSGNSWRGMDVLIFNSWHWWTHTGSSQPIEKMHIPHSIAGTMALIAAIGASQGSPIHGIFCYTKLSSDKTLLMEPEERDSLPSINLQDSSMEIGDNSRDIEVGSEIVSGKKKLTSDVWAHFNRIKVDGCQYGESVFVKARRWQTRKKVVGSQEHKTFNEEETRRELAMMVVLHDYPLSIVDHVGFRRFVASFKSSFQVMSRNTLKNDIMKIYSNERVKCYNLLEKLKCRIAITTDMWIGEALVLLED